MVDMSTVDPDSSARAAERMEKNGGWLLRAPVTGSISFLPRRERSASWYQATGRYLAFCRPYLKVPATARLGWETASSPDMKIIINMMLACRRCSPFPRTGAGEKLGLPWGRQ